MNPGRALPLMLSALTALTKFNRDHAHRPIKRRDYSARAVDPQSEVSVTWHLARAKAKRVRKAARGPGFSKG